MTGKTIGTILGAALLVLGNAGAAMAASTYTISGDFGSSVFKYGSGTGGGGFTQQSVHSACEAELDCYSLGGQGGINKNVTGSDVLYWTADFQANAVVFHPSAGLPGTDAVIRFVAPLSAAWQVSGRYWRTDITTFGNGTRLSTFSNIGGVSSLLGTYEIDPNSYGQVSNFSPFSVTLAAGDYVEFGLHNIDGNHLFDSTGIDAEFSANVPEPASWAMLITGFGIVGAAARRQRAVRIVPA